MRKTIIIDPNLSTLNRVMSCRNNLDWVEAGKIINGYKRRRPSINQENANNKVVLSDCTNRYNALEIDQSEDSYLDVNSGNVKYSCTPKQQPSSSTQLEKEMFKNMVEENKSLIEKEALTNNKPNVNENSGEPEIVINSNNNNSEKTMMSVKYTANDSGPYTVSIKVLKPIDGNQSVKKKWGIFDIMQVLIDGKVDYDSIDPYSKFCWEIKFKSWEEANKLVEHKDIKSKGFQIYIPRFLLLRKGVIKGVPETLNINEIIEEINYNDANPLVVDAFRLKMKVKDEITEKMIKKDSRAVCLVFRNKILPENIYYKKLRIPVDTFIPSVKQCYKCGQFGHFAQRCQGEDTCLICGLPKHPEDQVCTIKCLNCGENHKAWYTKCKVFKQAKNLNRIMATENVGYIEAKKIINGWKTVNKNPNMAEAWNDIIKKNNNNKNGFPNLPTKNSTELAKNWNKPSQENQKKTQKSLKIEAKTKNPNIRENNHNDKIVISEQIRNPVYNQQHKQQVLSQTQQNYEMDITVEEDDSQNFNEEYDKVLSYLCNAVYMTSKPKELLAQIMAVVENDNSTNG